MNILKSMFISTYMMLAMVLAGSAGWILFHGGSPLAWTGVLLTTVPLLGKLGALMLFRRTARTSAHFPRLNLLAGLGTLLAVSAWFRTADWWPALLAAAGWAGLLLYVYWYSHLDRPASPALEVGAILPGFVVRDVNLLPVRSDELTDRPTIWLFYRGNWCPLCLAQIKELAGRHQDFAAAGVRVALISPQPVRHTSALAERHDVGFSFLVDEGNSAARLLRLDDPFGVPMGMQMLGYVSETVLPTVIITGPGGKVVWTDQTENYRVRPEPATYLEVLRRHSLVPKAA